MKLILSRKAAAEYDDRPLKPGEAEGLSRRAEKVFGIARKFVGP